DDQPESYQIILGAGSLSSYESLPYKAVRIKPHGGTAVLIRSIDPRKKASSGISVASADFGKPDKAWRGGGPRGLRVAQRSIRLRNWLSITSRYWRSCGVDVSN